MRRKDCVQGGALASLGWTQENQIFALNYRSYCCWERKSLRKFRPLIQPCLILELGKGGWFGVWVGWHSRQSPASWMGLATNLHNTSDREQNKVYSLCGTEEGSVFFFFLHFIIIMFGSRGKRRDQSKCIDDDGRMSKRGR